MELLRDLVSATVIMAVSTTLVMPVALQFLMGSETDPPEGGARASS